MSGFLFSLRPLPAGVAERAADALAFVPGDWPAIGQHGLLTSVEVRSDRGDLWGTATDPETGVSLWLGGRLSPDAAEWDAAEALPCTGGLASRHALAEFLGAPDTFPAKQSGAFSLVVWDPRDGALHLATDRMGFAPVYAWSRDERPVLASHPDVLAEAVESGLGSVSLDVGTMAEVVARGRALPPRTYYREVEELAPGTVTTWRGETAQRRTYWAPRYRVRTDERAEALADDLAEALTASVRRRTLARLGPAALMLSGGADSRAILYGARDPAAVTSVTLYDEPNAELATARALAARAGSPHLALQRSPEYYGEGARAAVRLSGGQWNVIDAHWTGFAHEITALGAQAVLTGCYADYLFKGLSSNRRHRTLLGRALPLYEFAPYAERWYVPGGRVADAWAEVVRERTVAHFAGLDLQDGSDAGRWALEERRVVPLSRAAGAAGRLALQRTVGWDPVFADTALVDLYERIPPSLKLNGQVWEQAVARICRAAGDVPNNNSQSRIGASETRKVLAFLYGVAYRKLMRRDLDGTRLGGGASRGSWPDFAHYARHSPVVQDLWRERSTETTDVLSDVLGRNPYDRTVSEWIGGPGSHVFFRVVTLKLWLDARFDAG